MLKLHRLEISGFKSFVDPTGLEFAGGITAIVGPNGCGKSNLSDAITWVLGEQSAKSLRGDTMEDVIFNGSERRKPLGMAEVSLTMLTDPGFPGSEDGRLTLARRVFRTGESQYRLNGKVVRLKEIRDLLMDTGLGIRAYSVIEQGKIGMILSGKPQERRKLIEEAAGITRYKARKRIAEVKLEEATANLLRLDDIVAEVERNLRSLKRQAGAARRFQEKQAEVRQLLEAVLDGRWSDVPRRLEALRGDLDGSVAEDAALAAALHADEAALAAGRETLDARQQALAERHRLQARSSPPRSKAGRSSSRAPARPWRRSTSARRRRGARRAARGRDHRAAPDARGAGRAPHRAGRGHEQAGSPSRPTSRRSPRPRAQPAKPKRDSKARAAQLAAALGELTALRNRLHREQLESEKGTAQRITSASSSRCGARRSTSRCVAVESARARTGDLTARAAESTALLAGLTASQSEREAHLAERRGQGAPDRGRARHGPPAARVPRRAAPRPRRAPCRAARRSRGGRARGAFLPR